MSHSCYEGGGPCPACAEEAFLDRVEEETLRHMEEMTVAIMEIAGEIDCEPHKIQELLWDFVEETVRKRLED